MPSKLTAFCHRHGRPFTVKVPNGKGDVSVLFHDGYVTIQSRQPRGTPREIHLTRSAWLALLSSLVGPTREMRGPDFDRFRAERVYYAEEARHQADLRAQKRERRRPRRRRQRT